MSVLKATILLAVFTILSKILGLLRIIAFSHTLGASQEFDVYVAALRLPDLLFNLLIAGTLSVAFIPVFVAYLARDREAALKIASTIFNFTLVVMAIFAALGIFFAGPIVKIIVPGFESEAQAQTIALTRILMLSPLLFSLSSVATAILHSFKKFLIAAIAPLFYNLAIIIGVVFFYPTFGLSAIGFAVVIGALTHFLLQLPQVWRLGLRPFSGFDLRHPAITKIGKLFLPRIIGMDLGQISFLLSSIIGSFLPVGTLAIFYIAYDLETVPLGVFATSFAIAAFPTMAQFFAKGDREGFKIFFSKTTVQILFLMIPISVLMLLLRAQIVRLIPGALEGTKFTFADTRLAAQTLGFFTLSLFAQSLIPLLARSFYAMQNTIIPVAVGLVAAAVNIFLAVALRSFGSPYIFAIAFSVAAIIQMLILLVMLHRRLGDLQDEFLILRVIKISVASAIMGIATYLTLYAVAPLVNMQTYLGVAVQTLAALLVAIVTYLGVGLLINLPETKELVIIFKTWFEKFNRTWLL